MIDSTSSAFGARTPLLAIPALNADRSVAEVVAASRAALPGIFVLGVDDGSTDGTRSVLKRVCDHVIAFETNRGKGAALRAAFTYATRRHASRPVVTIDADGQHDPSFIPQLVEALDGADIVIGTRQLGGDSVPPHRRIANRLSTAAAEAVARVPIGDSQSGFRALAAEVVASVHARGDRYEFETDYLVRASMLGYRIAGVAIPTIYGPPSHFREIVDTARVVRMLWSHRSRIFRP